MQPKQVWGFLILLFIILSSLPKTNGNGNTKTVQELQDLVDHIKANEMVWLEDATKDPYPEIIKRITNIFGRIPKNEAEVDKDGIYSNFVQAYHPLYPSVWTWFASRFHFQRSRERQLQIKDFQKEYDEIPEITKECQDALAKKIQTNDEDGEKRYESFTKLEKICKNVKLIKELDPNSGKGNVGIFLEKAYRSLYQALEIFLGEMEFAAYSLNYGDWYNFKLGIFQRMLQDSSDYCTAISEMTTTEFPEYIKAVSTDPSRGQDEAEDLKEVLKHIKWRLTQAPYDQLCDYANPQTSITNWKATVDKYYHWWNIVEWEPGQADLNKMDPFKSFIAKTGYIYYVDVWDVDIENFTVDYNDGVFDDFYNFVDINYKKDFWVTPFVPGNKVMEEDKAIGIKYPVADGEWNWQYLSGQSVIQNLRLAWDLLGAVREELKCYMRKTYYFDLRQQAIKNTQLDLKEGYGGLFSGISRTMNFPCRLEDDLDLVTRYCTRENNEICAPAVPLDPRQRPDSYHHGGKSLLKPQWIYQFKDVKVTDSMSGTETIKRRCVARKDWTLQIYQCRCGFRLDCGEDLGENITCQLQPNDLLRGQCRGSVGYPCKTLPLSKGKHHESCVSGYCNMKKNSCEDEKYYSQTRSGATTVNWKVLEEPDHVLRYLALLIVLMF